MSIASVLVLVSCLMLIGLVFLSAVNLNSILAQFSARNVIVAYPQAGLTQTQRTQLQREIEALPGVAECSYVSSQEALERILANNQGDYPLLEGADAQFMPESFEVTPAGMEDFDGLVAALETLDPAIASVRHFQGVAAQLSALERALTILGLAVIGILLLVSVFIISSTVQATMYSRQQEIKVMKSVGAAPSFIRWPFLVEGLVLGLLSSLAALALVFVVYLALGQALEPLLSKLLSGYSLLPFARQLKTLLPGFLGVGLLTGGGGSMLSISRYLKEKVYENSELDEE
jgi:cell division transport system permease protein